jgi:hypothetical protein
VADAARFRALLNELPDTALLPVSWIREQLETTDEPEAEATGLVADLDVPAFAKLAKRTEPTVRGWLRAGRVPGAYKLNNVDWRIPPAAARAFFESQRTGEKQGESYHGRGKDEPVDLGSWRKRRRGE